MDDLNPRHDTPAARPPHADPLHLDPPNVDPGRGVPPVTRRRSIWPWLIFILVILLVIGGILYWRESQPDTGPRQGRGGPPAPPVVAATATKGDVKITDSALGTVTPLATVTLQTQIAGQLTEIGFKEGQDVKKGDFLAQIDPRPYQAALDQAQGQLAKDQALLRQAQVDLVRYKTLAAQDSIAKQQADDQEWLVHQDEGQVKVDQAQVENAQLNLAYCRIVSPATGRIGLRGIDPGNYVTVASSTALAVITQMQPISVVFVLPEDNLPAVLKRMHEGATLTVAATDRSGTIPLGNGTLLAVDSQIDTTTGTVKLKAQFANNDETLFPNQFVNVALLVDTLKDTTIIPTAAIQRGAPGTYVYMIKQDDTVTVQKVKLGPVDGDNVAIIDGLQPGDRVVVDGADKLREGAKVKIGTNAPAGSAKPANTGPGAAKTPVGAAPAGGAPSAPASGGGQQPASSQSGAGAGSPLPQNGQPAASPSPASPPSSSPPSSSPPSSSPPSSSRPSSSRPSSSQAAAASDAAQNPDAPGRRHHHRRNAGDDQPNSGQPSSGQPNSGQSGSGQSGSGQ
jgi:multidrug efflux system membrane fusion protein